MFHTLDVMTGLLAFALIMWMATVCAVVIIHDRSCRDSYRAGWEDCEAGHFYGATYPGRMPRHSERIEVPEDHGAWVPRTLPADVAADDTLTGTEIIPFAAHDHHPGSPPCPVCVPQIRAVAAVASWDVLVLGPGDARDDWNKLAIGAGHGLRV